MTNAQMLAIFKENEGKSFMAGLRAVWNAGWYEAKGITPNANSRDVSADAPKPAAVVKIKKH